MSFRTPSGLVVLLSWLALAVPVPATALLSVIDSTREVPIHVPADLVVSGDDRFLYVLGNSTVALYERDVATGATRFVDAYLQGYAGVDGIFAARSMALSPDDRFLYVASPRHQDAGGDVSGAIAVFERDAVDGSLRLASVATRGFQDPGERFGTVHLAFTSTGDELYAASTADEAVLRFRRDPADGSLRYLGSTTAGIDPRSRELALAFDGDDRFLYLTQNRFTDTAYQLGILSVYARDASTGALTFVEEHVNRSGGIDDMDEPTGVTVSPDGAHVYVMNSDRFPYDTDQGAIVAFARDDVTGRLTFLGSQDRPPTPADSAWNDDGTRLYVAGVSGGGDEPFSLLLTYARDPRSGALTTVAREHEGPLFFLESSPLTVVALTHDHRHLYAGTFDRRLLTAWELGDDGEPRLLDDATDPTGGRGALRGAARAATSPDGRHLYVSSIATQGLAIFERDPDTGGLDLVGAVPPEEPVSHEPVAVSTDGRWVYALAGVYARDPASGLLERVPQPDPNVDLRGHDLVPSPDGQHLYVLGASRENPIAVYAQADGGRLRRVELTIPPVTPNQRLGGVVSAAFTADGAYLFCAGVLERANVSGDELDAVWVLARDATTGRLRLVTFTTLGPSTHDDRRLAVTPDGAHAYLTRPDRDELFTLTFDRPRGNLFVVDRIAQGVDGIDGLDEPSDVALSPSGGLVYVAGRRSDAITVFALDDSRPENGRLTRLATIHAGPAADDALVRPRDLVAAPGGGLHVLSSRTAALTTLELECAGGPDVICLAGGRFRVDVRWHGDAGAGVGRLAPLRSDNSGLFWFFSPDNWEMLVKVLDGCRRNGRYWVFVAATTDVGYDLRVVDTATGAVALYDHPPGAAAPAITDTAAFACP